MSPAPSASAAIVATVLTIFIRTPFLHDPGPMPGPGIQEPVNAAPAVAGQAG